MNVSDTGLQYTTLGHARLLKDVGFDWFCHTGFMTGGGYPDFPIEQGFDNYNRPQESEHTFYSRPTIPRAFKWLRDVKKMHVEITLAPYNETQRVAGDGSLNDDIPFQIVIVDLTDRSKWCHIFHQDGTTDYYETESIALTTALTILKEKKLCDPK